MTLPPLGQLRKQAGLTAYEKPTSELIIEMVADGQLPERTACVSCGASCGEMSLVAICERTRMRTHSDGGGGSGGGFLAGFVGGIPLLLPFGGGGGSESRVTEEQLGRSVVVPVPMCICDRCWHEVSGRRVSNLLQRSTLALGIATAVLLVLWLVGPFLRFKVPMVWVCSCFGGAVACGIAERWYAASSMLAVKSLLRKTPIYRDLCAEYPDAEVVAGQLDEYTDPVQ